MNTLPYKSHQLKLETSHKGCYGCFFLNKNNLGCYRPEYFKECSPFTRFVEAEPVVRLSDVVCHEEEN